MGKKGQAQKKHSVKSKAGAAKGQRRAATMYIAKSNSSGGPKAKADNHSINSSKLALAKGDVDAKRQRDAEFEALRQRTLGANATKQRALERKTQGATVLNFLPPSFPLGFQQPPSTVQTAPLPIKKSALDSMLQEITDDRGQQPSETNPECVRGHQFAATPSSETNFTSIAKQHEHGEPAYSKHWRRGNAFAALAEPDAPQWNFAQPSFALNPAVLAQHAGTSTSLKPHAAFHSRFQKNTPQTEEPIIAASLPASPDAVGLPETTVAASSNQTSFREEAQLNDYDSDGSL